MTTEGNYLDDGIRQELDGDMSREAITILSGEDLEILAVVGKITKSIPTTGTAGGANTGDGTCTGVTGGEDTQIGAYTLTCASVPDGAAVVPTTGTAGGGNTGDGTMTGVADGGAAQVGTYTLICIAVPDGAAVVPATGTAGGANTGDGTMTGVADGGAAQIGTYTLTCIAVPEGAAVVPATGTAGGGNTGAGTMTGVADGGVAKIGTYNMICTDATVSGSEIFQVTDPDGLLLAPATVGVAYVNAQINFTLNDGGADFIVGDTFTVPVTEADHNAGTFRVVDPDGNELPNATVAVAYTNAQLNFTINDGAADFILTDTFTVVVAEADHNVGTFQVVDPDGNEMPNATVAAAYTNAQLNFTINDGAADFIAGDTFTVVVAEADHDAGTFNVLAPNGQALPAATVGVAYTNAQINFTLTDGAADFIAGDTFTITVAAGSGKCVELDPAAVDGSQVAYGITIAAYDASLADVAGVAVVRNAVIVSDALTWPAGITVDQKTQALAELAAVGMTNRIQL